MWSLTAVFNVHILKTSRLCKQTMPRSGLTEGHVTITFTTTYANCSASLSGNSFITDNFTADAG